jgi:hypothetical protein
MKSQTFRLDDIARRVVHAAPEVYFELLSPVNPPSDVTWACWSPEQFDVWSGTHARTNIRRLDTQLAPSRWLPDLGYTCVTINLHELFASELQSAARSSPVSRASTCIAHLIHHAFPALPPADIVIMATELRMRQAPRKVKPSWGDVLLLATASATPGAALTRGRDRNGVLRFEQSRALFDLDPNDPQFAHPRCWPLVCLSPNVSADQILQRHGQIARLQREHHVTFPGVSLLLASVGRARFPKDRRFDLLEEYAVNDAAAQSALPLGHMTEQERNQLWIDAEARQRRLHEERLKAAEEQGESRGRLAGKREGKLEGKREGVLKGKREGVLETARLVLAGTMDPEQVEAEMSKLTKLKTADTIQRALAKLLAR